MTHATPQARPAETPNSAAQVPRSTRPVDVEAAHRAAGPIALGEADARARARFERAATRAGVGVRFSGTAKLPMTHMLYEPVGRRPWLLAPLHTDPVIRRDGRLGIPEPLLPRLRSLASAWDEDLAVMLALELPAGPANSSPLAAVELLRSPARSILDAEAAKIVLPSQVPLASRKVAAATEASAERLVRRASGAIRAAGAVALLPLVLVAGLDPIVFAVLPALDGRSAPAWYEIARWDLT